MFHVSCIITSCFYPIYELNLNNTIAQYVQIRCLAVILCKG